LLPKSLPKPSYGMAFLLVPMARYRNLIGRLRRCFYIFVNNNIFYDILLILIVLNRLYCIFLEGMPK
jgi:hypothetical protein